MVNLFENCASCKHRAEFFSLYDFTQTASMALRMLWLHWNSFLYSISGGEGNGVAVPVLLIHVTLDSNVQLTNAS